MGCPGRRPVECMDIDNTSPTTREEGSGGEEEREGEIKDEERIGEERGDGS